MRGIAIEQAMTLTELANACEFSVGYLRKFIREGFVEVDRSTRPVMAVSGFVPLTKTEWRERLLSSVPEERAHMVGFEDCGRLQCLVGEGVKVLSYASTVEATVEQRKTLETWLGVSDA